MNELLNRFIYLKHTKTFLKSLLNNKTGTNSFNFTLSIIFWPRLGFPVNLSFNFFFTSYFKWIFIKCIFRIFVSYFWYSSRIFGIWITDVLFVYYLNLIDLYRPLRALLHLKRVPFSKLFIPLPKHLVSFSKRFVSSPKRSVLFSKRFVPYKQFKSFHEKRFVQSVGSIREFSLSLSKLRIDNEVETHAPIFFENIFFIPYISEPFLWNCSDLQDNFEF